MQRYHMTHYHGEGIRPYESEHGEWVRYEDAVRGLPAAMKDLAQLATLRAQNERLRELVDRIQVEAEEIKDDRGEDFARYVLECISDAALNQEDTPDE